MNAVVGADGKGKKPVLVLPFNNGHTGQLLQLFTSQLPHL